MSDAPRPDRTVLLGAGVAATILAMAALVWWRHAARDAEALSIALQAPVTAGVAFHGPAPPRPSARLPAPDPAEPPLSAQVERLLATHGPADAFKAYRLIADCAAFNAQHDRVVFDPDLAEPWQGDTLPGFRLMSEAEKRHDATFCARLTERERQSRLDYLAFAARAGVPDAAIRFVQEGPFGDPSALATRPGDPLVKAWKADARAQLARAADDADIGTLGYLVARLGDGDEVLDKDPALAYRYATALGMVYAHRFGSGHTMAALFAQQIAPTLAQAGELTPDRRAAETIAARAIADRDRARRAHADAPGTAADALARH